MMIQEAVAQAGDTLHGAAAAGHAEEAHGAEEGVDIVHHLADGRVMEFPPFGEVHLPEIHLFGLDLSITKYTVYMWIAAALLLLILLPMARRRGGVYHGLFNAFEALIVYVRDEIVYANIGREDGRPYVPFIATLFFFILFMNLLGLVPFGATATGNFFVTGALALVTLIVVEISGMRALGFKGYMGTIFFIPPGLSAPMKVLMLIILTPVELMGKLAKPFALMVRLFANMMAGHTLVLSLLGMIFLFATVAADSTVPAQLDAILKDYGRADALQKLAADRETPDFVAPDDGGTSPYSIIC